jgi:hypothetical protein
MFGVKIKENLNVRHPKLYSFLISCGWPNHSAYDCIRKDKFLSMNIPQLMMNKIISKLNDKNIQDMLRVDEKVKINELLQPIRKYSLLQQVKEVGVHPIRERQVQDEQKTNNYGENTYTGGLDLTPLYEYQKNMRRWNRELLSKERQHKKQTKMEFIDEAVRDTNNNPNLPSFTGTRSFKTKPIPKPKVLSRSRL